MAARMTKLRQRIVFAQESDRRPRFCRLICCQESGRQIEYGGLYLKAVPFERFLQARGRFPFLMTEFGILPDEGSDVNKFGSQLIDAIYNGLFVHKILPPVERYTSIIEIDL